MYTFLFYFKKYFSDKIETEYTVTKNYIDSIKKHIKELHLGSKEELMERLDTYEYNLTQKKERKHKV